MESTNLAKQDSFKACLNSGVEGMWEWWDNEDEYYIFTSFQLPWQLGWLTY